MFQVHRWAAQFRLQYRYDRICIIARLECGFLGMVSREFLPAASGGRSTTWKVGAVVAHDFECHQVATTGEELRISCAGDMLAIGGVDGAFRCAHRGRDLYTVAAGFPVAPAPAPFLRGRLSGRGRQAWREAPTHLPTPRSRSPPACWTGDGARSNARVHRRSFSAASAPCRRACPVFFLYTPAPSAMPAPAGCALHCSSDPKSRSI